MTRIVLDQSTQPPVQSEQVAFLWKVRYMVDPGDGIVSTRKFKSSDDIEDAIKYTYENYGYHFIVSMELV